MTISVLLKCISLVETKSFYKDILGFEVHESSENTITVKKENGRLIFTDLELWPGIPSNTATIYFALTNVDEYFNSIKDTSIILWPLDNTSYGSREFGIKDNSDYHIAFAQNIV